MRHLQALSTWLHYGQWGLYRVFKTSWAKRFVRLGHAAKGGLYGLIGLFAIHSIIYDGHPAGGSEEVLIALAERSVGNFILAIIAVGLLGYSFWRLVQLGLDPAHPNEFSPGRIVQHWGYAISGLTYLGIAYTAGRLAIGLTVDFDDTIEDLATVLFEVAIGPWALVAIGLGVIAVGVGYGYGAYSGRFISEFQKDLYVSAKQLAIVMGKIGFTARGVSFILIGAYLLKSAYNIDNEAAGGLGKVLDQLDEQPFGEAWLGAIAFGFMAYAAYMVVAALYRKFPDFELDKP